MNVAVVVPRRPDAGRRDDLWAYVESWWSRFLPEYPVTVAVDDGPGKFSIAAARNRGALEAGPWDVVLLVDADTVPAGPDQVRRAVATAAKTGRLTLGHDQWVGLSKAGSNRILAGWVGRWERHEIRSIEFSWSSLVAVPRDLWTATGGLDERFVGYGFEDTAYAAAAKTLGGGAERVHGNVFHLWHPRSTEKQPGAPAFEANRALRRRYLAADGNVDAMRALLAEAPR